jgi:alkylation response protein AidB-like acyl-CoA dehydrogenase
MFMLNENQRALQRQVRAFVDREVAPAAARLDASKEYPRELIARIGELGFCALPFPGELGGGGLGAVEGAIVLEELSRGMGSLGFILCAHMLQCCFAMKDAVSPEQKESWLMPAIACRKLLTLALSEERGGSDALGLDTIAARQTDGSWILNGSKCWITNAGVADGYIVGAKTNLNSRSRSVSLFYVDSRAQGVDDSERVDMIGLNNSPTGTVRFTNCRLPAGALIGEENEGYRVLKDALNWGRLALGAVSVGMAQSALEHATEFSLRRGNYDRSISSYQGVSFPIAEMYTKITVARNMLYHVAEIMGAGERSTMEAAALKLFASEMCLDVCREAVLIHGGRGFKSHSDMERILRDAQLLTVAEGTSQICKVVISNGIYNTPSGGFYGN